MLCKLSFSSQVPAPQVPNICRSISEEKYCFYLYLLIYLFLKLIIANLYIILIVL